VLIYTVAQPPYGGEEYLVYVASKRFPDDTALIAVFKTEDAANEYARLRNKTESRW
jgi:hypothetical protein